MNPPHTVTNSNTRGEQAELGPKDNTGTQSHQGRQRDTQTKKSPTLTSHILKEVNGMRVRMPEAAPSLKTIFG